MSKNEKIDSIINDVCKIFGTTLYEWRLLGYHESQNLIVYITKPDGVSIDDCADFSKALSEAFEERKIFESPLTLEVSSPGLNRELKVVSHFVGATGENLKVKILNEQNRHETVIGILKSVKDDKIYIQKANENKKEIRLDQIKKAKTVFK
ncbi:MAG: hypothetical protein U9P79_04850 [Candidatus Cloacimonadota bacterium]|nr:hypothetical protein [Candidatus Cloacimonadota bacterium]